MAALPGVIQIQGDITKVSTAEEIISHFEVLVFTLRRGEYMNGIEAPSVCGKEYVTTLFVWENLTSVSERYICAVRD